MVGDLALYWVDDIVLDEDGRPEARGRAVMLAGPGLTVQQALAQLDARCQVARLDHGPGKALIGDSAGNHFLIEGGAWLPEELLDDEAVPLEGVA